MARRRSSILSSVVAGASTFFSQFAQFFRFRPGGGATSGQQLDPGRPIVGPEDLVAAATAAGVPLSRSARRQWSQSYICILKDSRTGQIVARIRTEVQYDEGTSSSTRYTKARQQSLAIFRSGDPITDRFVSAADSATIPLSFSCRQVGGGPKEVPRVDRS